MKLPEKLKSIKPYDPTEDRYEVKLDANESPFSVPDYIMDKIINNLKKVKLNRYPDPSSVKVTDLASDFFSVPLNCVCAGNGSDELISIIINAFLDKGDKIMITEPDFSMYSFYAHLCGNQTVKVEKNAGMEISADNIIKAFYKEKPSMFIFSNPCNPTGQGLVKPEVIKIINALDCLVIIDEAYMDFFGQSVVSDALEYDNVIVLRTCSKAFGLAGIRLGFALGNPYLVSCIQKSRSPFNINSLTQAAAEAVLSEKEYLLSAARDIISLRDRLISKLSALSDKYPGTFKVLPSVSNFAVIECENCKKVYNQLLSKGICVRYFKSGFLRVTAGTEDENTKFLTGFENIIKLEGNK